MGQDGREGGLSGVGRGGGRASAAGSVGAAAGGLAGDTEAFVLGEHLLGRSGTNPAGAKLWVRASGT